LRTILLVSTALNDQSVQYKQHNTAKTLRTAHLNDSKKYTAGQWPSYNL